MKLTDVGIRRVDGNGKVQKLSDGGGLFLYVTPTGKKSWRLAIAIVPLSRQALAILRELHSF